jgi:hypothetical protein
MRSNKPANADRQMLVATVIGHSRKILDRLIAELDTPPSLPLVKSGLRDLRSIADSQLRESGPIDQLIVIPVIEANNVSSSAFPFAP